MNRLIGLIILVGLFACQPVSKEPMVESRGIAASAGSEDVHTYAQPQEAVMYHLDLELEADFPSRTLSGKARYQIKNMGTETLFLDARDLDIKRVTLGEDETETTFQLSDNEPFKGQALEIAIEPATEWVTVEYTTRPEAGALLWLNPQQTAGKQHPFLFTQGQAILTRTWIPIQDSPGIRFTYEATVKVPKELMAVMSASNPQGKNETGVYKFEMKQPIPAYLMALAIGDLEFAPIGERTGVYAEPQVIEKAAYEFGDMEKMLISAEELYGPYLWDRYDVIVLPPSFPFGGMENPRLTFATPTIIAGDRSLTSLIAHELAHSWSGNLVTNATWNDFWLNEGFTVYFERRIMEALYGKPYAEMLALLGHQDLTGTVADLTQKGEAADTHLHLDLTGRDPDDGMTDIAYEKGYFMLRMLEEKVGKETFDTFLKTYFDTNKFHSLTTSQFVKYATKHLLKPAGLEESLITDWIYGPGLPDNCPEIQSNQFTLVDTEVEKLTSGGKPESLNTADWNTHQWLHFIRQLPSDQDNAAMAALDQTFSFSQSGNSEILAAWFEHAIRSGYSSEILPQIETFLVNVGRRKFLTPLYRAFKESGGLDTAKAIYAKARPNYHSVATGTIDALLEG